MNKVEKIQCEQLCLVGQAGVMPYGVYVYNEDKTKIYTATEYYDGEEAKIEIAKMNDGKPCLSNRFAEVLDFTQMIDELELKGAEDVFKKRLGKDAYPFFFKTIFSPSLGAGVEIDVLAKASKELEKLQANMIKEEEKEM